MYLAELENAGVSFCFLARDATAAGGRLLFVLARARRAAHQQPGGAAGRPARRASARRCSTFVLTKARSSARGARRSKCGARTRRRGVLYERFGFSVAGVRRGYYTKPVEDALVLWRETADASGSLTLNRPAGLVLRCLDAPAMTKEADHECSNRSDAKD